MMMKMFAVVGLALTTVACAPSSSVQPTPEAVAADQTQVQISEADLTQRLNDKLVGQPLGSTPLGPATLTSITAQLADGHLLANGNAQVGGATVPVSMTASSAVQDGRAILSVDDLKAAGVPLPSTTRDAVQQALQAQVDDAVARMQMRVSAVQIADGKLTVFGRRG